jgi:hypothetical protein
MTIGVSPQTQARQLPPYSSAIRITVGVSLVAAGVLNGGAQYLGHLIAGADYDQDFGIPWGAANPVWYQTEQFALLLSSLFLPIGFLGLAQVSRWSAPRMTAIATVLVVWGMWGFHNILAVGYAAASVAPGAIGVTAAVKLTEEYGDHPGILIGALIPHLVGSFFGVLLLSLACWRSGAFPKLPLVLLIGFLLWDFLLPPVGPLEAHALLFISLAWLGVRVIRMPQSTWLGSRV